MGRWSVGGTVNGAPRVARYVRPAQLLVAAFLSLAAAATAWFGAMIIAFDFTRTTRDSPYLIIGMGPLLIGAAATFAAWLLIGEGIVRRRRAWRTLFATVVLGLPGALGVWHSVYEEILRPILPYRDPSLGYTFDYPRAYWTFLPSQHPDVPDETVILMNWAAFTPDEVVPSGGLRVKIGPRVATPVAGEAIAVGKGRYPGTIRRSDVPMAGGAYTITVVYTANGGEWQIDGTFAERPAADNPNTDRFFTIVGSIEHNR